MEISTITFDKSAFRHLAKMLGIKKKNCRYCGDKVDGRNVSGCFGSPIKLCCTNISCMLKMAKYKK